MATLWAALVIADEYGVARAVGRDASPARRETTQLAPQAQRSATGSKCDELKRALGRAEPTASSEVSRRTVHSLDVCYALCATHNNNTHTHAHTHTHTRTHTGSLYKTRSARLCVCVCECSPLVRLLGAAN